MPVSPVDAARTLLARARVQHRTDAQARELCLNETMHVLDACRAGGVLRRAWVIGSLAWGGFGIRSDIDVVVDLDSEDSAVLFRIADEIGQKTGRQVDVLAIRSLPESFRQRVLAEGYLVA